MKLWILRPIESCGLWSPWFDKSFGFVVRAATEADARRLAASESADEGEDAWLNSSNSTCVTLDEGDQEEVVMCDFKAA